jgi:metal-responsive CopG/Arc/MetJ family transcriptional regulator
MRKKRLEKSMAMTKGDKKMIRTTYSIPEDLLFKVKFQALKEKRSISDLIRFLLERYLKDKGQ